MTSNSTAIRNDPSLFLRELHVAEEIVDHQYTREIINRAQLPVHIVRAGDNPHCPKKEDSRHAIAAGKRHLFLCANKGEFFKPCPATTEYRCCDYHVLNIGANCPIDCIYCILQAYLNNPWITSYVNIDKMFSELRSALIADPQRFFRIGTGEFTDSLALERLTGLSRMLVEFLGEFDNVILELKTKSSNISNLDGASHGGKSLVSWSLNSSAIIKSEEIRSATLQERLNAAKRVAEWGYKLGFHFDPVIYHKNWREGYDYTVEQLFSTVPNEAIVWISLGGLRYLPSLKPLATNRFPHSRIFFQEFIAGLDGKSRYFREHREEMYKHIVAKLEAHIAPHTCLYFCMESEEIWQSVLGFSPDAYGGIGSMLDRAAIAAINKY